MSHAVAHDANRTSLDAVELGTRGFTDAVCARLES